MAQSEVNNVQGLSQISLDKSVGSPNFTQSSPFDVVEVDDKTAERRLLLKCDLNILPILFVMYMFAFLDRINIGNAKIQGMMKELNMTGPDYNMALIIFFVPYIMLEVPSNLALRKVAPSTWLSGLAFFWGIASMCQGLVSNHAGLVACRFFLGVFEAGVFPGCIFLISSYYKRHELQKRWTIFFCSGLVAGAFGGLLAFALAKMDGLGGLSGWRWIFIIEGLATIAFAVVAKFTIVDWPEDAKFLSATEKAVLIKRISEDGANAVARMDHIDRPTVFRILRDWKIWTCAFMYMGIATSSYSTAFFIPTILNEFGYTPAQAQLRTIPVYVVSTAAALLTAYLSDRLQHRYSFTITGILVATAGYIMLLDQELLPLRGKYGAIFLVTAGTYIAQPIIIVWQSNNMAGSYKRAFSSAIQIAIGNVGGIIGGNIYKDSEKPAYKTGYGTAFAMIWFSAVLCTIFFFGLRWENRMRERGARDWRLRDREEVMRNLGDDHPEFRFTT